MVNWLVGMLFIDAARFEITILSLFFGNNLLRSYLPLFTSLALEFQIDGMHRLRQNIRNRQSKVVVIIFRGLLQCRRYIKRLKFDDSSRTSFSLNQNQNQNEKHASGGAVYQEVATGFRTDFFVLSIVAHRRTYAVVCRYAKYVRSNVESLDRTSGRKGTLGSHRERKATRWRKGTEESGETVRKSMERVRKNIPYFLDIYHSVCTILRTYIAVQKLYHTF